MYLNSAFSTLLVHTLMRKILSISILCTLQLNDNRNYRNAPKDREKHALTKSKTNEYNLKRHI